MSESRSRVRVNESDVSWVGETSPKGDFEASYRSVSKEIGVGDGVLERQGFQ